MSWLPLTPNPLSLKGRRQVTLNQFSDRLDRWGRTLTGTRASSPARVLVADSFAPEGLEVLRARADVDVQRGLDEEGLARTLTAGRYDALIVRSESRVTSAVLGASPRLRVVARA